MLVLGRRKIPDKCKVVLLVGQPPGAGEAAVWAHFPVVAALPQLGTEPPHRLIS